MLRGNEGQMLRRIRGRENKQEETEKIMKPLIVYYSRTGSNKIAALELQKILGADAEELIDTVNRNGLWGFLRGGMDAFLKKETVLGPTRNDPANYELVILSSPIWASNITPALRTYINKFRDKFKKVAFVSVSGMPESNKKAIPQLESLIGKKLTASLLLGEKDLKTNSYIEKLKTLKF
jgi:flavodoxin